MHWRIKDAWIRQAVENGGDGGIICEEGCDTFEKHGFGNTECGYCEQAWRKFPGEEKEYYNNP